MSRGIFSGVLLSLLSIGILTNIEHTSDAGSLDKPDFIDDTTRNIICLCQTQKTTKLTFTLSF